MAQAVLNDVIDLAHGTELLFVAEGAAPTLQVQMSDQTVWTDVNAVQAADNVFRFGRCRVRFSALPSPVFYDIGPAR